MYPTIEVQQQSELAQRRLVEAAQRQVEEVQEKWLVMFFEVAPNLGWLYTLPGLDGPLHLEILKFACIIL